MYGNFIFKIIYSRRIYGEAENFDFSPISLSFYFLLTHLSKVKNYGIEKFYLKMRDRKLGAGKGMT